MDLMGVVEMRPAAGVDGPLSAGKWQLEHVDSPCWTIGFYVMVLFDSFGIWHVFCTRSG